MSYVYLDDKFDENAKIEMLSDSAMAMHVRALCYVNRNDTKGFIARARVPRLTTHKKPLVLVKELVNAIPPDKEVGLWIEVEGGWEIHGYREWYEKSLARKEKARKAAKSRYSKPPEDSAPSMLQAENGQSFSSVGASSVDAITPNPKPQTPNPPVLTVSKQLSSTDTPKHVEDEELSFLNEVWSHMAQQALRQRKSGEPIIDVDAWLATAARNAREKHHVRAFQLRITEPKLGPYQVAEKLEREGLRAVQSVPEQPKPAYHRPFTDASDTPSPGEALAEIVELHEVNP